MHAWTDEEACDDRALVDALRAREPSAPRVLVERYQRLVFGLCARMLGDRHEAEDAAQETFLRALRSIDGFDRARRLRPWLLGIAANQCRTSLQKRSRRPRLSPELFEAVDARILDDVDDLAGALGAALARLRPDYRLVFILYHEQHLPYDEIARAAGRPIGTVRTWLHRARQELASMLAEFDDGDS